MTSFDDRPGDDAPIIETAAGTTSPENARSGKGAYVIAAIAIAVMALFGTAASGCVSLVSGIASSEIANHGDVHDVLELDPFDDEDDISLDQLIGNQDGLGQDIDDVSVTGNRISRSEAMGTDLTLYNATLDSFVKASDYANAQVEVSSFVRDLVLIDRDATSRMAESLRIASWDDQVDLDQAIDDAIKSADDTIDAIRATKIPKATGSDAATVSRDLESGRTETVRRWEMIKQELQFLADKDEVDVEALFEYEDDLYDLTEDAADDLRDALSASTNR